MKKIFYATVMVLMSWTKSMAFYTYGTIPANPTVNDSVYLYCSGTTILFPVWRFNDLTSISEDTIFTSICYRLGQNHFGITVYDTISLGKLSAGYYTVILQRNSTSGVSDSNCIQSNWFDYVSFGFWVSDTTTGVGKTDDKFTVSLHPIPASTIVTLSCAPPQSVASITNLHGQSVMQLTVNDKQQTINVAHLPAGMYFCIVESAKERKVLRFVRE